MGLGANGTGGEVALWIRPDSEGPPPVAFLGRMEGRARAFARSLGEGPRIWPVHRRPRRRSHEGFQALDRKELHFDADADPEQRTDAEEHLAAYQQATKERFGSLPPFDELVRVDPALHREFDGWVAEVLERVFAREDERSREAAAMKHREARAKAERHAARSVESLPEDASEGADGSRYEGRCCSCRKEGELRLTRFEELTFGICFDCYFSSAW